MALTTRLGALRDRVVVQTNTTTPDPQGGRAASWGTLATVWARVEAIQSGEALAGEAMTPLVTYRVTMRYRDDLRPAQRVQWTNYEDSAARTLEVHAVDLSPDAVWATLTCAEVPS